MLSLLIFFLFAISISYALKKWLEKRLGRIKADYELASLSHAALLKAKQGLNAVNLHLSESVQNLIAFYEITKELTKYLTLDEVFMVFWEKLRDNVGFQECKFIKPDTDLTAFSSFELFPLMIDKEEMGHLAIKGVRAKDRERFFILFNQLLLVLKRVRLYEKIEELAITDTLTGMFLRRHFQERLEEEIVRCNKYGLSFAFLMLDLDHFKSYNDRYGHLVGDALLSTVARIIKYNVREIDTVGRYGGEEFSVILPVTDRKEAEYVSSRLCQEIAKERIRAYDEELQITVSIGGSFFPYDAKETKDLIDKADRALYRVKQAGRNGVCFWDKGFSLKE